MAGNYDNKTTIDDRLKDLRLKVAQLNDRIQRLEDCRKIYDDLPFKDGDPAFHKDSGPVLVRSIEFGSSENDYTDIKYVVVTLTAATLKIPYKELLPLNDATKALYGKPNPTKA